MSPGSAWVNLPSSKVDKREASFGLSEMCIYERGSGGGRVMKDEYLVWSVRNMEEECSKIEQRKPRREVSQELIGLWCNHRAERERERERK